MGETDNPVAPSVVGFMPAMLYPREMSAQEKSDGDVVSRGAHKLAAALSNWRSPLAGKVCLDVGAGSGGFTQVMLEQNPKCVYAVDVGYGQFEWKLRNHPHLVLLERKNARFLTKEDVPDPVDFFSVDVSFISIYKIFPALSALLTPEAYGVVLFKPNFEAPRREVARGGLLLDPDIHLRLLTEASEKTAALGLSLSDLMPSPIRGSSGNIEYLLRLGRPTAPPVSPEKISAVVSAAFGR